MAVKQLIPSRASLSASVKSHFQTLFFLNVVDSFLFPRQRQAVPEALCFHVCRPSVRRSVRDVFPAISVEHIDGLSLNLR